LAKILVTGAAGFIGSFLVERLIADGHTVIGVDNLFRGKVENLAHLKQNLSFEKLDVVEDTPALEGIFQDGIVVVFHYAAVNGTEHFYDKPLDVLRVNTEGTINLLKLSAKYNVKKFIFASSSEVYGEPLYFPTDEQHPLLLKGIDNPRHTYAVGKVTSEYYTRWCAQAYGFKYLILRIFNTYGPRMDSSKYGQVIPEFIRKVLLDPEFTIIGSGKQTRSFCYISDNINMTVQAANEVDDEVLNIGSEQEIEINELGRILHELAGRQYEFKLLPSRQGDPPRRLPDTSKARALLGYEPKTQLRNGLRKTLEWYQKRIEPAFLKGD